MATQKPMIRNTADQTQCIRCGKSRILAKTWSEHIGLSDVTYTQNICPDAACQKEVEVLLKDRHDVFTNRLAQSLKRRQENRTKGVATRRENKLNGNAKKAAKRH